MHETRNCDYTIDRRWIKSKRHAYIENQKDKIKSIDLQLFFQTMQWLKIRLLKISSTARRVQNHLTSVRIRR